MPHDISNERSFVSDHFKLLHIQIGALITMGEINKLQT